MAYIKPCVKGPLKSNNEDKKGINEKKKESIFSSFLGLVSGSEGRKQILERESLTSLSISRRSDRRFSSEQEEKLVYAARAMRGHRFCRVSITPGGRGFLLLGYSLFKKP